MRLAPTFFLLTLCAPLAAQPCDPAATEDACPDTTDWKRYFPLDVGNVWHYYEDFSEEPPNRWSWSITGEAEVDGETYVTLEYCEDNANGSSLCDPPVLLRYNELPIIGFDMQTTVVEYTEGGDRWWEELPCILGADFNAYYECFDFFTEQHGSFTPVGEYEASVVIAPDLVSGSTRKEFQRYPGTSTTMVAGLGVTVFAYELQSNPPELVYAHVDGQQYGTPAFASCEPDDLESGEVCPDTTNWQRYFPLEVGNRWQYRVDRFIEPDYVHGTEIVGETEIDGESYVLARRCAQGASEDEPTCGEPVPIRYDETDRVVVRRFEDSEGNVSFRPYHTSDFGGPQPLDAPFGAGMVEGCSCFLDVSGAYGVGFEGLGDTEKTFDDGFQGTVTLVAGVGVVDSESGKNDFFETLVYARVGGAQVGSPPFEFPTAGEDEGLPLAQSGFTALFPNPARETATARYTLGTAHSVTLAVLDVLGRRVRTLNPGRQVAGPHEVHVETSALPAGLYLLQLRSDDTVLAAQRLAVVR